MTKTLPIVLVKRDLESPLARVIADRVLAMCRYPQDCKIDESLNGRSLEVVVEPHRADFRVICGKRGRQIKALKYFAKRAGEQSIPFLHADVILEEGTIGEPEPPLPFAQDPTFDVDTLRSEINMAATWLFRRAIPFTLERQCDKLIVEMDVDQADPEAVPSVLCLSDLFYPAAFRRGMICDIRPRKLQPVGR